MIPATLRRNAAGAFIISTFKYTNHAFSGLAVKSDLGETVGWNAGSLYTLFSGTTDDGEPIAFDMRTKDLDFGFPGTQKRFFRLKPLGLYHDDEEPEFLVQLRADTARMHDSWIPKSKFSGFVTIPYDMDGFTLSIRLAAYASSRAGALGFALDMKGGTF
jgi:hypothetical protein